MASLRGQDFRLEVQGRQADSYISGGGKPGAPGVLVLHAWWGLTPFFKQLCDRLAGEGFVALGVNLFGDKTARTIDEARALIELEERDHDWMKALTLAAVDRLRQDAPSGGLGVVGFSMGTYWSSLLSTLRPDDIRAVVLFYGAVVVDFSQSRADFLGNFADPDEWEPPENVHAMEEAMRKAGREITVHTYPGVGHWFFEDNQPTAYNADAAKLAWGRTVEFLNKKLR